MNYSKKYLLLVFGIIILFSGFTLPVIQMNIDMQSGDHEHEHDDDLQNSAPICDCGNPGCTRNIYTCPWAFGTPRPRPILSQPSSPDWDGSISLHWSESYGTTYYKVYRSDAEFGTYTLIATPSSLGYTDIVSAGIWWYYVRAHNNNGDSGYSNKVSVVALCYTLSINTPEAITYTEPMSGYYAGTYGFENETDGDVPNGWEEISTGDAHASVVGPVYGHKKCLKLSNLGDSSYVQVKNSFENQGTATIEFWFLTTDTWANHYITLQDDDVEVIKIRFGSLYLSNVAFFHYWKNEQWVDFSENPIGFLHPLVWYHFRIDFLSNRKVWKLTINGDSMNLQEYSFWSEQEYYYINSFKISTDASRSYYDVYLDAVGYSWDINYDIGDNKYEGLFLEFEPSDLDYIYCTFDGQTRRIYGDTIFPMPKSNDYSIKVVGKNYDDPFPYIYTRYFSVDYAEKIAVFFYASDAGAAEEGDISIGPIAEPYIFEYIDILASEGYSKFFTYRDVTATDSNEFDNIMNWLADKRVDYQDEIFFYLRGHGRYDDDDDDSILCICRSYVDFPRIDYVREYPLFSSAFKQKMDNLYLKSNTLKIGFLVEGCYSGGFVNDFEEYPFLAISASNESKLSYAYGPQYLNYGEGIFSHHFFDCIAAGYNAVQAFNPARGLTYLDNLIGRKPFQEPQINNLAFHGYLFFN